MTLLTRRRAITGITGLLAMVGLGALLFPRQVYDLFIWQYFWGPVVADAAGQATATFHGVVAHRGYTLVSELGYGVLLVYALLLLLAALDRYDLGTERGFAAAFAPFVVGGGLLRVVEDAASAGVVDLGAVRFLLISPLIYGTVFVVAGGTLVVAAVAARRGIIADYRTGVVIGGTAFVAAVGAGLSAAVPVARPALVPAALGVGGAALLVGTGVVGVAAGRWPVLSRLLGGEALLIVYGHLVDAVSTAYSLSLLGYGEKHPVVRALVSTAGTAWVFVPVKLLVVGGILLSVDEGTRRDDPVFTNLVLLAVLAVGLGPGTRNLVRAVFGV